MRVPSLLSTLSILSLLVALSTCNPVVRTEIDPYTDTRSALASEYARYQRDRYLSTHNRLTHSPSLNTERNILKSYFLSLARPSSSPPSSTSPPSESFTNKLSNINDLRRHHRFFADVDPGSHLPLGQVWNYDKHGPYPAARLMYLQSALEKIGEEGIDWRKVERELENAQQAHDDQVFWQLTNAGGGGGGKMVFTDDVGLVRAGIEYWQLRLGGLGEGFEEGLKEGLKKVV